MADDAVRARRQCAVVTFSPVLIVSLNARIVKSTSEAIAGVRKCEMAARGEGMSPPASGCAGLCVDENSSRPLSFLSGHGRYVGTRHTTGQPLRARACAVPRGSLVAVMQDKIHPLDESFFERIGAPMSKIAFLAHRVGHALAVHHARGFEDSPRRATLRDTRVRLAGCDRVRPASR